MTPETEDGVGFVVIMDVADIAETNVTMDRLARVYIKMRDKLSQLTREYE